MASPLLRPPAEPYLLRLITAPTIEAADATVAEAEAAGVPRVVLAAKAANLADYLKGPHD